MKCTAATDNIAWDDFLRRQSWRPFLQSWTMGDVYADIGQRPIRLAVADDTGIRGICFAHLVKARRGTHLSVPYGPVLDGNLQPKNRAVALTALVTGLKKAAQQYSCSFIRMSPFLSPGDGEAFRQMLAASKERSVSSPLHLLAEHVWYLPLLRDDGSRHTTEELMAGLRKTTRNLVRRAERDGVTITASTDPLADLPHFIALHDETRKRHGFTPYTASFFRAQIARFAPRNECTLYLARYQGNIIAGAIHMHACGETSYHHGASASVFAKVPASYLLQWTAICDALKRGDRIYNFWGVAPLNEQGLPVPSHPFAGVTLFKTGFGGKLMDLTHCLDIPITPLYWCTYAFEIFRKWRRGF